MTQPVLPPPGFDALSPDEKLEWRRFDVIVVLAGGRTRETDLFEGIRL
jgi:hypothetical protein